MEKFSKTSGGKVQENIHKILFYFELQQFRFCSIVVLGILGSRSLHAKTLANTPPSYCSSEQANLAAVEKTDNTSIYALHSFK